jgi:hypothetical protein
MARRVDEPKSPSNQTISNSRQTKIQNKAHPKSDSGADWARDDEDVLVTVPPE